MSYYLAKVNFESGEVNRKGDPVVRKSEFLVAAESVIEAETKVAEYMRGTLMSFETVQISKTKIEAVVDKVEELL
jgi:hypothetical protein